MHAEWGECFESGNVNNACTVKLSYVDDGIGECTRQSNPCRCPANLTLIMYQNHPASFDRVLSESRSYSTSFTMPRSPDYLGKVEGFQKKCQIHTLFVFKVLSRVEANHVSVGIAICSRSRQFSIGRTTLGLLTWQVQSH